MALLAHAHNADEEAGKNGLKAERGEGDAGNDETHGVSVIQRSEIG